MSEPRKFERHVYLKMKSLEVARSVFMNEFQGRDELAPELVPTTEAMGRITARPVMARFSSPGFHAAAMDGIAVRAESTYGTSQEQPRDLAVGTEAVFVNTGHVLPEGMDAVIMIEQVQHDDPGRVTIEAAAYPWQHVRKVGEDIVATEMLLPQGCLLGPYELGALVAAGAVEVWVKKRPKVTIIPTGSELVTAKSLRDRNPGPGPGGGIQFGHFERPGSPGRRGNPKSWKWSATTTTRLSKPCGGPWTATPT